MDKEGKYLQSKIFKMYKHVPQKMSYFHNSEDDISLNKFLTTINSEDLYDIKTIGTEYGMVLVLYFTDLDICHICNELIIRPHSCKCKKGEKE